MGKIILSHNVSLDGVVQDPTGEEGFKQGGWFAEFGAGDFQEWAKVELDEALAAEALLLGRRTDEWFAARWLSRTGPWADRLNTMPKYVVSSTAERVRWGTGTVLRGDVVSEVSALRHAASGDILVYASAPLVHTLMEHDLVDEVRLTVYPVVLGAGERLFSQTSDSRPMRLTSARAIGQGLAYLTYERARAEQA